MSFCECDHPLSSAILDDECVRYARYSLNILIQDVFGTPADRKRRDLRSVLHKLIIGVRR